MRNAWLTLQYFFFPILIQSNIDLGTIFGIKQKWSLLQGGLKVTYIRVSQIKPKLEK